MNSKINISLLNPASKDSYDILLNFLLEIDGIFPIPLSKKINLYEYTHKYLEKGFVLIASDNEKIVGVNIFYGNDYEHYKGHITILGIIEGYRNCGLGSDLINESIRIVKDNGMKSIDVLCNQLNSKAKLFYQKNGFVIDNSYPSERDYLLCLILN